MCFSEDISLYTFLTGFIFSSVLYLKENKELKVIGLFFAFVSLMQLIEYLLWKHKVCDDYNKNVTYIGMIINHLQPIVLFALVHFYLKPKNENYLLLVLYVTLITFYSMQFNKECTLKDEQGHLNWKWNSLHYNCVYLLFLGCLVIFGLNLPQYGKIFSVFSVVGYFASYFIYKDTNVIGSMWCFFAAFAPLLFLIFLK